MWEVMVGAAGGVKAHAVKGARVVQLEESEFEWHSWKVVSLGGAVGR